MTPYESHPKMEGQVCIWHFIKPVVQPGSRHLGALGAPGQGGQDDGAPGQSGSGLFYQMCSDKPMCFPDFSWGMIYKTPGYSYVWTHPMGCSKRITCLPGPLQYHFGALP